jgi:hypothetical protein
MSEGYVSTDMGFLKESDGWLYYGAAVSYAVVGYVIGMVGLHI